MSLSMYVCTHVHVRRCNAMHMFVRTCITHIHMYNIYIVHIYIYTSKINHFSFLKEGHEWSLLCFFVWWNLNFVLFHRRPLRLVPSTSPPCPSPTCQIMWPNICVTVVCRRALPNFFSHWNQSHEHFSRCFMYMYMYNYTYMNIHLTYMYMYIEHHSAQQKEKKKEDKHTCTLQH